VVISGLDRAPAQPPSNATLEHPWSATHCTVLLWLAQGTSPTHRHSRPQPWLFGSLDGQALMGPLINDTGEMPTIPAELLARQIWSTEQRSCFSDRQQGGGVSGHACGAGAPGWSGGSRLVAWTCNCPRGLSPVRVLPCRQLGEWVAGRLARSGNGAARKPGGEVRPGESWRWSVVACKPSLQLLTTPSRCVV